MESICKLNSQELLKVLVMHKSSNKKINDDFKGKDILSLDQFDTLSIKKLFRVTAKMAKIAKNARPSDVLKGNIVTLLFYEPSSRTFGSFSAAVKQLGGQTVEIQNPQQFSSVSKGETLEDTIKVFEAYCDAIIIRHPQQGAAQSAADAANFVPIINAGDGVGEHPTQGLLDLYTIYNTFNRLSNLTGVIAGDLLNGRTVHSLLQGLALERNNTLYLLSPKELRLRKADFFYYKKTGLALIEFDNENEIPKNAHFWYWTRVQKERFKNLATYEKVRNKFVVTKKLISNRAGAHTIIMHPLPRVGEILPEVDEDQRAVYLKSQIRNGMYIRMALIAMVLGKIA